MSGFSIPPALVPRAASGRLAHAYILTGAEDEALMAAGTALAAGYLCQGDRPPCGTCKDCRKVERGVHPDVVAVEPEEGKELKVDQIRALRTDAYIRPNEGQRKVYLLRRCERMNASAQNAFLKVLEEGPAYAAFLLLTPNDASLLPTIRSRCETVRVESQGQTDQALERAAGELAGLLLGGPSWRLVSWCVPYEKAKRDEVLPLWDATRRALLTYRRADNTAKAVELAMTLSELCAALEQNVNVGVLWGRLWAAAG